MVWSICYIDIARVEMFGMFELKWMMCLNWNEGRVWVEMNDLFELKWRMCLNWNERFVWVKVHDVFELKCIVFEMKCILCFSWKAWFVFAWLRWSHHFERFTVATLTSLTVMEYLCHRWPRICSTSRAGTAYPSRASALKPGVCRVRVAIQCQ